MRPLPLTVRPTLQIILLSTPPMLVSILKVPPPFNQPPVLGLVTSEALGSEQRQGRCCRPRRGTGHPSGSRVALCLSQARLSRVEQKNSLGFRVCSIPQKYVK